MSAERDSLRDYADELDRAAARLRSGEASGDEAAELVERCAKLAATVATELDARARATAAELPLEEAPEQERLL